MSANDRSLMVLTSVMDFKEAEDVSMSLQFSINHMIAPNMKIEDFFAFCKAQTVNQVEIRNDIPNDPMALGMDAADVKALAEKYGVEICSINALQRFNEWNETRADEAQALISYAAKCGAKGLVMCPVNDHDYGKGDDELAANLRESLTALKPLYEEAGIVGLVEPLGFEQCSLRLKAKAIEAIKDVSGEGVFRLVHDTFHHHLAGETDFFPEMTGLMHISGVEDPALAVSEMLDDHRILVGNADRLDNVGQVKTLLEAGYAGPVSFEPFAPEIHALEDAGPDLSASIAYIRSHL